MEKEIWKRLDEPNEDFEISNLGRARQRRVLAKGGAPAYLEADVFLRNDSNRLLVRLRNEQGNYSSFALARVVLSTFKRPGERYRELVKHANGRLEDCRLANLSWTSERKSAREYRRIIPGAYRVPLVNLKTGARYPSIKAAAESLGLSHSRIRQAIVGTKTYLGPLRGDIAFGVDRGRPPRGKTRRGKARRRGRAGGR